MFAYALYCGCVRGMCDYVLSGGHDTLTFPTTEYVVETTYYFIPTTK